MSAQIDELKALPTLVDSEPLEESYPFSHVKGGLPCSGLVEWVGSLGSGKTELALEFLSENPELQVAWIEKEFTFFPGALLSHPRGFEKTLFIDLSTDDAQDSFVWAASQVLLTGSVQVLVLSHLRLREIDLRRLQIAVKRSQGLIIFLSDQPSVNSNWVFSLQLRVKRAQDSFDPVIHVIKRRSFHTWKRLRE